VVQSTEAFSRSSSALAVELGSRICVSPPYFALRAIEHARRSLNAVAYAETAPYGEYGPMSAAEIGRHGAIAGLSCLALERQDVRRHYYLARKADCEFFEAPEPYGTAVELVAVAGESRGREASASITAKIGSRLLARMNVTYAVIREDLFGRLFAKYEKTTHVPPASYDDYLPLRFLGNGRAMIERVPAHACGGHFSGYPALPVAVLMGQLVRLAVHELGRERYSVSLAKVEADNLAWAGDDVELDVKLIDSTQEHDLLECSAKVGEQRVGRMRLGLRRR